MKPETVMIGTRVTPKEDQTIDELIQAGKFINKSDFVRTAVRAELRKHRELEA
jgi:Arc/MetJ-type ribon-helix-helix transcriptional regulator